MTSPTKEQIERAEKVAEKGVGIPMIALAQLIATALADEAETERLRLLGQLVDAATDQTEDDALTPRVASEAFVLTNAMYHCTICGDSREPCECMRRAGLTLTTAPTIPEPKAPEAPAVPDGTPVVHAPPEDWLSKQPWQHEQTTLEVCCECNWTNTGLLNVGEFEKPRWLCHGCLKRAVDSRDALRVAYDAAKVDGERLDWLEKGLDTSRKVYPFAGGFSAVSNNTCYDALSVRAAIDAARQPKEKQ